ncbi:YciI family protein [Streptomyces kanasensis]|uniref:YciI family protein n=1 Tax=Streptomyces kanasensis TaxID=936756 RepID=UPI003700D186
MAEYLLLIYEDEARTSALEPAADAALVDDFQRFMARNATRVREGRRLAPTSAAVSARRDADGGVRISDGAFVESKEVVAGYFLVEAADLDEALAVAGQVPVPHGGVEVRPIRPVRPTPDA